MERTDPVLFETEIYAKDWDPTEFKEELRAVHEGHVVAIGTATDPYQPAERKFNRTRTVLEALRGTSGLSIFLTTKSNLVSRDATLFKELSEYNEVHVTVTVTTIDQELARLTEPFAPRPDLRLQAVSELASAGVSVGVIASPVLPLLTDTEENLEAVAHAAKEAGADQFGANVLFLQPEAQRVFFPFLEERFPQHIARYRTSFRKGPFLKGSYPDRIRDMIREIRARVDIPARDMNRVVIPRRPGAQMALF